MRHPGRAIADAELQPDASRRLMAMLYEANWRDCRNEYQPVYDASRGRPFADPVATRWTSSEDKRPDVDVSYFLGNRTPVARAASQRGGIFRATPRRLVSDEDAPAADVDVVGQWRGGGGSWLSRTASQRLHEGTAVPEPAPRTRHKNGDVVQAAVARTASKRVPPEAGPRSRVVTNGQNASDDVKQATTVVRSPSRRLKDLDEASRPEEYRPVYANRMAAIGSSNGGGGGGDDFSIPRPMLIVPVHTYGIRRRRTGNPLQLAGTFT